MSAGPELPTEDSVWVIRLADVIDRAAPRGRHTVCPTCGRPLDHVGRIGGDHVLPRAMGGVDSQQATVCDKCNHTLGRELEGQLLNQTGALTPLASRRGYAKGVMKASTPEGAEFTWNPGTHAAELRRPHVVADTSDPNRTHLTIALSEEIVGPIEGLDVAALMQHPVVQKAIAEHRPRIAASTTVEQPVLSTSGRIEGVTELVRDLPRLRRLAVKIALNAAALVWGDEFLVSPLAEWLRMFLAVDHDPATGPSFAECYSVPDLEPAFLDNHHARVLDDSDLPQMPPGVGFLSLRNGMTLIIVRVLGLELPEVIAPSAFPTALGVFDMVAIELAERARKSPQGYEQ